MDEKHDVRARVTGKTALYAIAGDPVAQVGAPARFNLLCEARDHDGVMVALKLPADDLTAGFDGLRRIGNLRGLILTIPHKIPMAGLVDELAPTGRAVGAVNAVRRETDGRWRGDMFDGRGCVAAARAGGHELSGRSVLQIGAGGVGRAIAFALAEAGIDRLTLTDLVPARAEALASAVVQAFPRVRAASGASRVGDHDTVVNASPLGMKRDDPPPVPAGAVTEGMLAIDVILSDSPTRFLAAAAAQGATTCDGRAMLEAQIDVIADFFGV